MPRVGVHKTINVGLTLTEQEAHLLRAMMQNPLADFESPEDKNLRESLFTQLTQALKGPDAQAHATNSNV